MGLRTDAGRYDSGDNAVDIRITLSGKGFDLRGQILGDGFENGEAELTGEQLSTKSKTGEMSEFAFTGVAAGEHKLAIRSGDSEIFIDPLKVG